MPKDALSSWLHGLSENEPGREMLSFERIAAEAGRTRIAGVDEAGRGPIAGPIVAASVILAHPIKDVNDSKKLSASQRETFYTTITEGDHAIGVAIIAAEEIDRSGIQVANYAAMVRSAEDIDVAPDFLLVDGYSIKGCPFPQERIIKGDQRSQSIAAASIIAKVTRDRIMLELAEQYPEYGFERHKGYGTKVHIEAVKKHGPCPVHRKSFAPIARKHEPGVLF